MKLKSGKQLLKDSGNSRSTLQREKLWGFASNIWKFDSRESVLGWSFLKDQKLCEYGVDMVKCNCIHL